MRKAASADVGLGLHVLLPFKVGLNGQVDDRTTVAPFCLELPVVSPTSQRHSARLDWPSSPVAPTPVAWWSARSASRPPGVASSRLVSREPHGPVFPALPAFWPARSAGQDSALADFSRVQDSRKVRQTASRPSTSAAFPPSTPPSTGFLRLFESPQYQKSWPDLSGPSSSEGQDDVRRCADSCQREDCLEGQKMKGRELGGRKRFHRGGAGEDLDVGAMGLPPRRVATPRWPALPICFTNSSGAGDPPFPWTGGPACSPRSSTSRSLSRAAGSFPSQPCHRGRVIRPSLL